MREPVRIFNLICRRWIAKKEIFFTELKMP